MRGNRSQDDRYYAQDDDDGFVDRRREQFQYQSPVQHREQNVDLGKSSMSTKDVLSLSAAVIAIIFAAVGMWSNLTQNMKTQEIKIEQLEKDATKELLSIRAEIKTHKELFDGVVANNTKKIEDMEKRIQDLDATLNQVYQTIMQNQNQNQKK